MKNKIGNLLGIIGAVLLAISLLLKVLLKLNIVKLQTVKIVPSSILIFAVSFLLVSVLIKLIESNKGELQHSVKSLMAWVFMVSVGVMLLIGFTAFDFASNLNDKETIDKFHKLYYKTLPMFTSHYMNIETMQYPADNWMLQELISELKPDFVVETGTAQGGTALFYAHLLEKLTPVGKVITVDIEEYNPAVEKFKAWGERVIPILGSSTDPKVVQQIKDTVKGKSVLLTLDSLHTQEHVYDELKAYSEIVPVGGYIVVQDTHLGGNPNHHKSSPNGGPMAAVKKFMKENPGKFEYDRGRERHLVTQNPSGYLKRVK